VFGAALLLGVPIAMGPLVVPRGSSSGTDRPVVRRHAATWCSFVVGLAYLLFASRIVLTAEDVVIRNGCAQVHVPLSHITAVDVDKALVVRTSYNGFTALIALTGSLAQFLAVTAGLRDGRGDQSRSQLWRFG